MLQSLIYFVHPLVLVVVVDCNYVELTVPLYVRGASGYVMNIHNLNQLANVFPMGNFLR